MDSLKVNKKGQIIVPQFVIEEVGLKEGEEVKILKRNGYFIMKPTSLDPLKEMQKQCVNLAEESGWETEEDIIQYCKQVRKELGESRRINNANNA